MKSAMIALLLTVWVLPAPGETAAMSTNMANFLTLHNGDYNNLAQYQADNTSHDFVELRTFPVAAPGFPGNEHAEVNISYLHYRVELNDKHMSQAYFIISLPCLVNSAYSSELAAQMKEGLQPFHHSVIDSSLLHLRGELRRVCNVYKTWKAYSKKHMVFSEYAFNGAVFNLFLSEVTEDSDNRIHMVLYNFTDPSQYKPGQYKVEDLSKLTPEDLHSEFKCEAEFEAVGPDFYGTFPGCRHFVNGKPSMYTGIITCNEIRIVVPRTATEESSSVPYREVITGPKHPVPDLPDGYISPCK